MDFEKAYKALVAKLKNAYLYAQTDSTRAVLEDCIPELAESEDEKIRKALIPIVDRLLGTIDFPFTEQQVLDWFEKQKDICGERAKNITANMLEDGIEGIQRELIEFLSNTIIASWVDIKQSADAYAERIRNIIEKQKEPTAELSIRLNGLMQEYVYAGKDKEEQEHRLKCYHLFWDALGDSVFFEQKPAEWSEEDFERLVGELVQDIVANEKDAANYGTEKKPTSFFLTKYSEKFKSLRPQPKVEWSEEDEKVRIKILHLLSTRCCVNDYEEIEDWLKSLLPQQKAELTLLDENIIKAAIAFIEQNDHFNYYGGIDKHTVIKALRSLKPHWKPSEEQMEALARATNRCVGVEDAKKLLKLLEQLKSL